MKNDSEKKLGNETSSLERTLPPAIQDISLLKGVTGGQKKHTARRAAVRCW